MQSRSSPVNRFVVGGLSVLLGLLVVLIVRSPPTGEGELLTDTALPEETSTTSTTITTTTTAITTTTEAPSSAWVDPKSSGAPWGDTVEGLLTFRGNPTRSYYGEGPVPSDPEILWRFPDQAMCSSSQSGGEVKTWCGSGWTGQPAMFERDGQTWVTFGAYSRKVHFLNADTGERLLDDLPTGDIIKGSVTIDPDGYPLLFTGSRDNYYRVVALDGDGPRELWSLSATEVSPTRWNNDWDGAGLVIDDYLFVGGENSQFHIVKLNRGYGTDGLVTVDPELVFNTPGWDDELIAEVGGNVSIENSVAISGDVVYFANSGGLIQGWDISGLKDGIDPTRVFRFWTGDDTDATLVIDDEGMLYAGIEYERGNARSQEVGQIIKLDPSKPDDPQVWGVEQRPRLDSGIWATPGLYEDLLIVPTDSGDVLGLDTATGEERWRVELVGPTWSSPVIVDGIWIQGDCDGVLHAFDITDTKAEPVPLWEIKLGGCIESTPALWRGQIVVGTRSGFIYAVG
ncbi:MAG: PQQ-binding-like beta-propeller repeat protein [Acidimicrobiaceae bacterium]|jgi:outer membrane protein assembly factor BamB|nr:PQQ-binding-like beta-propeller repeat protein [Acidimicrobiaceae bacterium]MBT5581586.1 PQQ-binding-like beta-propeller repeat protein [Acidimicrobiaceae bacterium]MBT5849321.1 PQQ-binding-like beta-propeller repeat protein [Acidimicrobiaceae bacterium]